MLSVRNLTKIYKTGEFEQRALDGVSLSFRENEFACILGQSGSGKTTLLNIISGLDRYDEGDLLINGQSTREFKDKDWDRYRAHRVGIIFQNYSLIQHQSVLQNVELSLTIAGVSREERRRRSIEALDKVGLKEHINKRPNQLSGGQMQRVAIARALVNDPEILLADEPTGALDSETGIQVVELLKEVAKDRLVIMVTHNAELAEQFATRTIQLLDGRIISDSDPYEEEQEEKQAGRMKEKARMNFFTSLQLSLANLGTKRGRTFLTAFAGSIGIIGIALILAISGGMNKFIEKMQKDTMTSYPIVIEKQSFDIGSMMSFGSGGGPKVKAEVSKEEAKSEPEEVPEGKVKISTRDLESMKRMQNIVGYNDLETFKKYLDEEGNHIRNLVGDENVIYTYNIPFRAFSRDGEGRLIATDDWPATVVGLQVDQNQLQAPKEEEEDDGPSMMGMTQGGANQFQELIPGTGEQLVSEVISDNFELIAGDWPKNAEEIILKVNDDNTLATQELFQLGLITAEEYYEIRKTVNGEEGNSAESLEQLWNIEDFVGREYLVLPASSFYEKVSNSSFSKIKDEQVDREALMKDAITLRVSGVVRKVGGVSASTIVKPLAYTSKLTELLIAKAEESEVVKAQKAAPETNVLTGQPFQKQDLLTSLLGGEDGSFIANMMDTPSYESILKKLGSAPASRPDAISIYIDSFEQKEEVSRIIDEYNEGKEKKDQISYTDFLAVFTSTLTTVVNTISYVLIAFVAISLLVSGLMITVITRISVLERTREIGILRALGASKRNVTRVFNAETVLIGFFAGVLGVGVTLLISLGINAVLQNVLHEPNLRVGLEPQWIVGLILLSVVINWLGGIMPARKAAKADPVAALRSE